MKNYNLLCFWVIIFTILFTNINAQNNAIYGGGNANGFSIGCVGSFGNEVPLPISLVSFTGNCNNQQVILQWTTASEINNDYFTILRSIDAVYWETIATISGNGNSVSLQNYTFLDTTAKNSISYYQLSQIDFDGNHNYFNTVAVDNCKTSSFELFIYPNPSSGKFNILYTGNKEHIKSIEIYNTIGERVYYLQENRSTIDLSEFKNGIYFVHFNLIDKIITKEIIVKK